MFVVGQIRLFRKGSGQIIFHGSESVAGLHLTGQIANCPSMKKAWKAFLRLIEWDELPAAARTFVVGVAFLFAAPFFALIQPVAGALSLLVFSLCFMGAVTLQGGHDEDDDEDDGDVIYPDEDEKKEQRR